MNKKENNFSPWLWAFFNPDGSPMMGIDVKTGEEKQLVDEMGPDEARKMMKLGYKMENIGTEPKWTKRKDM